jgi:hypothetical protein
MGNGNPVYALAVSGNDLYAGGSFLTAGGVPANCIAKWNGSSWAALGSGMGGLPPPTYDVPFIRSLAVLGNDLYAAGSFITAGGTAATNIAKWDGSNWLALGSGLGVSFGTYPPNSPVCVLAVSGSNVYAGGWFPMAGEVPANGVAKWDGSSWSALGSGIGNPTPYLSPGSVVRALAVSGCDLYAGGSFLMAGGKVSAYIARAYLPALPALSVARSGPEVIVSWPSPDKAGFWLEQAPALAPSSSWTANTANISDDGTNKSVTLPATNPAQFFRLRRP